MYRPTCHLGERLWISSLKMKSCGIDYYSRGEIVKHFSCVSNINIETILSVTSLTR